MVEITADIRKLRQLRQLQKAIRPVVELVVSGDRHIVVHGVHQLDHRLALAESPDGLSLDGVAVVHEDRCVSLHLQGVADLLQPGQTEALVDPAVDVAGVEDVDLPVFLLGGFRRCLFRRWGFRRRSCRCGGFRLLRNLLVQL